MSADDDRKAGAVAAAFTLSLGSHDEAMRADAKAISLDVPHALNHRLLAMNADHIAGAAQFFRELADALDEHAAKLRGPT